MKETEWAAKTEHETWRRVVHSNYLKRRMNLARKSLHWRQGLKITRTLAFSLKTSDFKKEV